MSRALVYLSTLPTFAAILSFPGRHATQRIASSFTSRVFLSVTYTDTSDPPSKMATTHPEFNDKTHGIDVAEAFAEAIHGKTILVTGVNPAGIGFTTSEAFVNGVHLLDPAVY